MSIATLEREIVAAASRITGRKLRRKDLLAWSTGPLTPETGEVLVACPSPLSVNAIFPAEPEKKAKK
jgi:hypothetical protein